MPKMKTSKSVAKRFTISASGRLKHGQTNKQHNTGKKTPRRKRRLRQGAYVDKTKESVMKKLLPYS